MSNRVIDLGQHWFRWWLVAWLRHTITWTNAYVLLAGLSGTKLSETLIKMRYISFKQMHLEMLPANCQPYCSGLDVIICPYPPGLHNWLCNGWIFHYGRWASTKSIRNHTRLTIISQYLISQPEEDHSICYVQYSELTHFSGISRCITLT